MGSDARLAGASGDLDRARTALDSALHLARSFGYAEVETCAGEALWSFS